jgi:hypothetical protein
VLKKSSLRTSVPSQIGVFQPGRPDIDRQIVEVRGLQGLSSALGYTEKDIGTRGAARMMIASTEIPVFIPPSHIIFDSLKKPHYYEMHTVVP